MNIGDFFKGLRIQPALIRVEKRVRFVIATLILTFLMLLSTFFFFDKAWLFIPLFILGVYFFTYSSILEGIEHSEWLMLFFIPVVFTISFYLFYFLFPVRWLTRVPFLVLYGISIYAILLTSNIFNVGVEKSLQLYRAAFSVNYLYQTIIIFLVSNILFSARENFLVNALVMGGVIFPLSLQLYWTIKLKLEVELELYLYSMLTSFFIAQLALMFSFVPFKPTIMALFITASYYSISGLVTAHLDSRLFKKTVREYLIALGIVACIALLTLNW